MTKTFIGGLMILTAVLCAFGAQAMTPGVPESQEAVRPARDVCAAAAWPQIPAACLEGGSRREVRYISAPTEDQHASDFVDRFNTAFE